MSEISAGPVVALIPARSGSKGVRGKNLRPVAGRPLLHYAVKAALGAARVDRVVVSTDGDDIEQSAREAGAEVLRHPQELSADSAPTFPVVQWDLEELRRRGAGPSLCVVLRATTPLRTADDIDCCIEMLEAHPTADSVVSVVETVGIHPVRLKRMGEDGRVADAFEPEGPFPRRRQELERLYVRNGGVYVAKPHVIERGGLWGGHCLGYVMPEERSVNINTEFQLLVAELLLLHGAQGEGGGLPLQSANG